MVPLTTAPVESPAGKTAVQKTTSMKPAAAVLGLVRRGVRRGDLGSRHRTQETGLRKPKAKSPPSRTASPRFETENATLKDAQIEEDPEALTNRAAGGHRFRRPFADGTQPFPDCRRSSPRFEASTPAGGAITNRQTAGNPERQPGDSDEGDSGDRALQQEAAIQQLKIANKMHLQGSGNLARRQKLSCTRLLPESPEFRTETNASKIMTARSNGIVPFTRRQTRPARRGFFVEVNGTGVSVVNAATDIPLGVILEGVPTTGKSAIGLSDGGLHRAP